MYHLKMYPRTNQETEQIYFNKLGEPINGDESGKLVF